jgi:DNA-binding ferritin-like protein
VTSIAAGRTELPAEAKQAIAEGLGRVLADTFTLYLKTHNFHWNVTGPRFRELHLMFEEEYNELWLGAANGEVEGSPALSLASTVF